MNEGLPRQHLERDVSDLKKMSPRADKKSRSLNLNIHRLRVRDSPGKATVGG